MISTQRLVCLFLVASLASSILLPLTALAHSGGPLDAQGCHGDRRKGDYHCHKGELQGYVFPSRQAMLEAVRSGDLPEKPLAKRGLLDRIWPGNRDKAATPATDGALQKKAESPSSPEAAPPEGPPVAEQAPAETSPRSFESRLRELKNLHDEGLISDEEYEARRRGILDEI